MWCERPNFRSGSKEKVRDYITYFEGTCEFCISNIGLERYLTEVMVLLEQENNDDEMKMLLNYLAGVIYYKRGDIDEAVKFWRISEEKARKLVDDVYIAKIFSYYSIVYYLQKDIDRSEVYFEEAASIFAIREMYTEMALHYVNYLFYKKNDPNKDDVAAYLDLAFYYVKKSDSIMDARVFLHLGFIYKTVFKDFIRGIGYLNTARDMCCRNNNVEMESMTLHILADGYMGFSHYQRAINIYEQLMTEPRYKNITENLKCMILTNLIPCYLRIGEYDSAEMYLAKMREFVKNTHWDLTPGYYCTCRWLTAQCCLASGRNLDEVPEILDYCGEFYNERPELINIEFFDAKLSESYGDYWLKKGDYGKALEYFLKMEEQSAESPIYDRKNACDKLARTFGLMGNYPAALGYRKKENGLFFMMDKENILNQYDDLYKKFFKTVHDESSRDFFGPCEGAGKIAYIDELTEFRNGDYFSYYVSRAGKKGRYSVLRIDIDDFNGYNECYGRLKGDSCLVTVAGIIKKTVCDEMMADICDMIRLASDDFLLMISDYPAEKVTLLAEKIVRNIAEALIRNAGSSSGYLTVSAGFATGSFYTEEDKVKLAQNAELALGAARECGGNQVSVY